MARRKNTKFIDPRYFMDEKTEIIKEDINEITCDEADAMMNDQSGGLEPTLTRSGHGPSNVDFETAAIEIAAQYGVDPAGVSVGEIDGDSYIVVRSGPNEAMELFVDLDDLAAALAQRDY